MKALLPEIRGVIFSRDRAMQLDAALTSLSRYCAEAQELSIEVLYAASSPVFAKQYQALEKNWRGALRLRFHQEYAFRTDLLTILGAEVTHSRRFFCRQSLVSEAVAPYVLFLVDDNIFCRPFSIAAATEALEARPRAIGFSLRLGRNTTYCYTRDSQQRVPQLESIGPGILAFGWTSAEGDFGYPLEVSSSVYRGAQVARILAGLAFSNPNTLEAQFANSARRRWTRRLPELLCFEQSATFCNAVNKVQTVYDNRAGAEVELSAHELARRFDSGLRIDTDAFADFTPNSCHCDVPFSFVQAAVDDPPGSDSCGLPKADAPA